uniref:Uncharacterized protein n=1 Tax=Rhizophora mucronata TaxID=61149 RepID=A0A2P2NZ45_RHIMU
MLELIDTNSKIQMVSWCAYHISEIGFIIFLHLSYNS